MAWRCLCGNEISTDSRDCTICGRTYDGVRPFAERIDSIDRAASAIRAYTPDVELAFKLALACLEDDMTLDAIASVLELSRMSASHALAGAIRTRNNVRK
jgi:hypothetical protein